MTKFSFIFIVVAISCSFVAADSSETFLKSWTHVNGNSAVLKLIDCDGENVTFLKSDGQTWTLPMAQLVPTDRRAAERLIEVKHRDQSGHFVSSHLQADDEVMDSPSDLDALDDLEPETEQSEAVSVIDEFSPPAPVIASDFSGSNVPSNASPQKLRSLHAETVGSVVDGSSSCDSCSISDQVISPCHCAVVYAPAVCCEVVTECCETECCETLCCPQPDCCRPKRAKVLGRLLDRLAWRR